MLLAYIDEIGEPGAFVAKDHPKFNTSPAFGYAGFIIPADNARKFGMKMTEEKRTLFKSELKKAQHPGRWERKGASMFRPTTPADYPQYLRVFDALVEEVKKLNGFLFYHADEKPLGTPKQTDLNTTDRETNAMRETLNRLARHADCQSMNLMVMIDQINEKDRAHRLPKMYAHILGRANEYPEMHRVIEPPMHIDSQLSANIQFADWVAAIVSRAIDYQLVKDSQYSWVADRSKLKTIRGSFTHESKLHLWQRDLADLNHSEILRSDRSVHPRTHNGSTLIGDQVLADRLRTMKAAAERAHRRGTNRR